MTTVAWKGSQIAADTRCNADGLLSKIQKLWKVQPNTFIGFAGEWPSGKAFVDWYGNVYLKHNGIGQIPLPRFVLWGSDEPNFCAIVLDKTGAYYWDNAMVPEKMINDYFAIGTGSMAAMAAMEMGATPTKAIQIAARFDPNTNDDIQSLKLRK